GGGAVELATFDFTNTLAGSAFLLRTQAVVVPVSGPLGNLWFAIKVDSRNEIFEANETNNLGVASIATVVPAVLSLDLTSTQIAEGASQPVQPTITRNGSTAQALTVTLTNGDPTELSMPASVLIPAGQAFATFNVFALSDGVVDGPQTVT